MLATTIILLSAGWAVGLVVALRVQRARLDARFCVVRRLGLFP